MPFYASFRCDIMLHNAEQSMHSHDYMKKIHTRTCNVRWLCNLCLQNLLQHTKLIISLVIEQRQNLYAIMLLDDLTPPGSNTTNNKLNSSTDNNNDTSNSNDSTNKNLRLTFGNSHMV